MRTTLGRGVGRLQGLQHVEMDFFGCSSLSDIGKLGRGVTFDEGLLCEHVRVLLAGGTRTKGCAEEFSAKGRHLLFCPPLRCFPALADCGLSQISLRLVSQEGNDEFVSFVEEIE